MNYIDLLRNCGYGNDILDIARGKIEIPRVSFRAPFDRGFGFPPALIPLWSNGDWPGYIGLVKHWFGERPDTFVRFSVERWSFREVAKNLDQLKAWLVYDALCNLPEEDFDEVGRFAESFGFCKAEEVEDIFAGCRNIDDLKNLPVFAPDLPAGLRSHDGEPDWLSKPADVDEIMKLIENRQFELAWYKLNGSGELANADILNILKRMSPATGDKEPLFNDLISCWEDENIWPKGILNG